MTLKWLTRILFVWGSAALAVTVYYAFHWFPRAYAGCFSEMGAGFALGLLCGWLAWLTLPVVALLSRKSRALWKTGLLLLPTSIAALFVIASVWMPPATRSAEICSLSYP